MLLLGLFATLAVLIAGGGLYAVVTQAVERRMHELGVRVALGASGGQIAQTVLAQGLRVTVIGLALGILITITAGRLPAPQIQVVDQFQRNDVQAYSVGDVPWLLAAVAGMLIILTLLACWFPLRKALAIDSLTTGMSGDAPSPSSSLLVIDASGRVLLLRLVYQRERSHVSTIGR